MENGSISLATLLRVKAEKIIKVKSPQEISSIEDANILKLLHELEVYSVELEMQNNELMVSTLNAEELSKKNKFSEEVKQRIIYEFELNQIEKEIQNEELKLSNIVSKDVSERYSDLFNFSSTGYLILSTNGEILDLNYAAARLLGKDRYQLKNSRLGFFVSEEDRPAFNGFLEELFKNQIRQTVEVNLTPNDSFPIIGLLSGIMTQNKDQCLLTLIDITEHKQLAKNKELTREILQLLNDPGDIKESVYKMLSVIKEIMGIDAVGIRLQEGNDYPYINQIGFSTDFIQKENSLLELDEKGRVYCSLNGNPRLACTCGMVLTGKVGMDDPNGTAGGSWWTNNSHTILDIPADKDPRFHPHNLCIYQGYASIGLVPIRVDDRIVGMIQLNDRRSNIFTLSQIEFFEGLASHIGASLLRKQAEQKLRANEELLRTITENVPDMIFQLDQHGTILYMNRALPGDTVENNIGKNFCHWTLPEYHELMNQKLKKVFKDSSSHTFITGGQDALGEFHWFKSSISPVKEGDSVEKAILITRDITENKHNEEILRENEAKMNAIIMTALDGFGIANGNGYLLEVNKTFCQLSGYSRDELLTMNLRELEETKNEDEMNSRMKQVVENGEDRFETYLRQKDGGVIYVEANVQYSSLNGGQFIIFFHDATFRKQDEESIRQSEGRYKSIFRDNHSVMLLINPDTGDIVDANPAASAYYGWTIEELCHKNIFEIDPLPTQVTAKKLQQSKVHKNNHLFVKHQLANGEFREVEVYSGPLQFGETILLYTIIHDITEQQISQEALRTSERRMDAVFNGVTESIMLLDLEGTVLATNETAASRFGMTVAEMTGKKISGIVSPETMERSNEQVQEMIETRAPVRFEYSQWGRTHDLTFYPIMEPSGEIHQFVVFVHDITEKKLAQEALRSNEERYSLIYNSSRDGVFSLDLDGKITSANLSFCNELRLEQSKVIGNSLNEIGLPEYVHQELESWKRKVLETNNTMLSEIKVPLSNGSFRYYEVNLNPLHDENDTIVGLGISIRNITRRKEATQALSESEKRFRYLVKDIPVGVILYGPASNVLMSNPKAMELLGLIREQRQSVLPFMDGWKTIHNDGTPFSESEHPVSLAFETGRSVHNVILGASQADTTDVLWLLMNVEVVLKSDGSIRNVLCSFIDITRQKKVENELRESEEKFHSLVWDMQVGVLLTGPYSEIFLSNPKATELFGLTEEQVLGKTAFDLDWQAIHEDGSPFQGENHPSMQAIITGKPIRDVIMGIYQPMLKKYVWLLIDAVPKFDHSGVLQNVLVTFIDITTLKNTQNELKKSEQRLKYHFENSPLAVVEWDKDYLVTQWSVEAEHMFGWKKEEAIGQKLENLNLVYEEDIPFVYYNMERLTSGKEDTIVSYNRNFTKSGRVIDCTWYNSILLDENGKMSSVMSLIQDITSRKQSENAILKLNDELEDRVTERTVELSRLNDVLKTAQDKYRTVSDFATSWEFWIDSLDHMIYCSPSCERITGYTSSEFEENSQLLFDIIHPDDVSDFQYHKKKELHASTYDHEFQYRILKKDGSIRWIGHYCRPVYDELGNYRGIRGSNNDITARKKMEELLTTSNQKYKLLSENINDGIFICKRGKFEYINNALNEIFGYEGHELEGTKLTKLVNRDYHEQLENFLYTNFSENQSCNLEVECLKKDSAVIIVEILLNYSSVGKVVYGVIHDVTEKKQLQKNMVKAIIQTEEKERAHFSKELHDGLGPLLSTIKLYLQWSERPNSNSSRDEIIGKAGEILEEALTTVKEISNKLSPHLLINYGLNSAIKNFVDKLNAAASYTIFFESNTVRRFDVEIEAALYRAIIECINNTVKYAQAKNIYIKLDDTGTQIQLQYRDDGSGFDINETLSRQKGLGLFNLQNRIHTIGGKVELFSEPGKGVYYLFTVNT